MCPDVIFMTWSLKCKNIIAEHNCLSFFCFFYLHYLVSALWFFKPPENHMKCVFYFYSNFLFYFSDHVCHPSPCANGGTCYVKNGSPYCACSDGFIGDKCQRKSFAIFLQMQCLSPFFIVCSMFLSYRLVASPCAAQPCLNGGTCYEYFNTPDGGAPIGGLIAGTSPLYHCHCPEGFTGKNCEGKTVINYYWFTYMVWS